jgi:hypothetical protein
MPAPGEPYDEPIRPLYDALVRPLGDALRWFDAHTHIGHEDPDGFTADADDILAGLDRAGQHRALAFPFHEPGGYPPANDRVIAAAEASGGRLRALARVDPNADGAVAEARRCLEAGAVGIKLHPRSDAFALPHPVVDDIVGVAAEPRLPVLFHAGRGIPNLGQAVVDLAQRHPGARLILAHAGISDVGWLGPAAAELPNLFFDTAWWEVADMLALFTAIPPARILYASDLPYGTGLVNGFGFLRCARAVGLGDEAVLAIAGAQLERLIAGEDPVELGPAPGTAALGPRDVAAERCVAHLASAASLAWRELDPAEPLALARLACHGREDEPLLGTVDGLIAAAQEQVAASPHRRERAILPAVAAQLVAGTPALLCAGSH